jgi:hypothetical protein
MKLAPYHELTPDRWNRVCGDSDQAWLFHRHEWIGIEERFWAERNHSFGILDDTDRLIGVLPLYLRKNGLGAWTESVLDSGMHRQTGLALVRGLPSGTREAAHTLGMQHLLHLADSLDVDRVQLNEHNLAPCRLGSGRGAAPFWATDGRFQPGLHFGPQGVLPMPGEATACLDQIVRLDGRDESALFDTLAEPCRRAVRKAVRSGLTVSWGDAATDVRDYYRLAQLSARRSGESLPPGDYYQSVFDAFHAGGNCRILFARHEGRTIGALWLLVDKQAVNFLAGVSDPEFLDLRVNEFLHWSAIRWAGQEGHHAYRLGPIFPDVPEDWPIHRISRFKKKFGGDGIPIIQGSLFRHPDRYLRRAPAAAVPQPKVILFMPSDGTESLLQVLRPYGVRSPHVGGAPAAVGTTACGTVVCARGLDVPGLAEVRCHDESGGQFYYAGSPKRRWLFTRPQPAYRALLQHTSFTGDAVEPVWVNDSGRASVAWLNDGPRRTLLVGLNVVEEMIRYRQGDPRKADSSCGKSALGFEFERPIYLFEDQILPAYRTVPWADRLGFFLAEILSRLTGCPLIEPLPGGARGAVLLSGDDDQAWLEKYDEQLRMVGDMPITYFLVPQTKHTGASLARLASNVELGLHPDALEEPQSYDRLCAEQAAQIRNLTGRKIRTVRNHGFLNRGYLGHLRAWEDNGLALDFNYPGVDGTALNGSFLPMRVRRADGSWSGHYSLLTGFGDGMIEALRMSGRQAARRIRRVAGQIEASRPGVLVCNFHPQNVANTAALHREALRLARRSGWVALGAESYLDWLETLEALEIERGDGGFVLTSPRPVAGLVLRVPADGAWQRRALPPWSGRIDVGLS